MAAACQYSALVGVVSSALQWNAASGQAEHISALLQGMMHS